MLFLGKPCPAGCPPHRWLGGINLWKRFRLLNVDFIHARCRKTPGLLKFRYGDAPRYRGIEAWFGFQLAITQLALYTPLFLLEVALGQLDWDMKAVRWKISLGFLPNFHAGEGESKWRKWKEWDLRKPVFVNR